MGFMVVVNIFIFIFVEDFYRVVVLFCSDVDICWSVCCKKDSGFVKLVVFYWGGVRVFIGRVENWI